LLRSWLLILLCTVLSEPVAAQQAMSPGALSWRAEPRERCRAMILTNFGGYVESATISGGAGLWVVADWVGLVLRPERRITVPGTTAVPIPEGVVRLSPAYFFRRTMRRVSLRPFHSMRQK
jgi:hypothetical protein